jgi:hypothetical protein
VWLCDTVIYVLTLSLQADSTSSDAWRHWGLYSGGRRRVRTGWRKRNGEPNLDLLISISEHGCNSTCTRKGQRLDKLVSIPPYGTSWWLRNG